MIGILIVAHGRLAVELLSTVEHVWGPQDRISAICVFNDDTPSAKKEEICNACGTLDDGSGVLIVTDVCGSSPFNYCKRAYKEGRAHQILHGANVPMLFQLLKHRHLPIEEAAQKAVEKASEHMKIKISSKGETR